MVCIHCQSETQVINSRHQKRTNTVWRRRKCTRCTSVVTTQEVAQYGLAWRVRSPKGVLTPFERDKLFLSLHNSCQHRKTALLDAGGLSATIIAKLTPLAVDGLIDAKVITQVATVALNRFDTAASVHYQAFHR